MVAVKFIIFILFLIVITLFATQNMGAVQVGYYDLSFQVQTTQLPVMLVVLLPFVAGFILAWLFNLVSKFKLKSTLRRQNKTIQNLEEELVRLKTPARSGIDSAGQN